MPFAFDEWNAERQGLAPIAGKARNLIARILPFQGCNYAPGREKVLARGDEIGELGKSARDDNREALGWLPGFDAQ